MKKWISLHTHSCYSIRDSVMKVEEALDKVKADGQNALALTEHGNMYSHIKLLKESKKRDIKGIVGQEIYLVKDMYFKGKDESSKKRANHLTLLCETNEGYYNLLKLTSFAATEGYYYSPRMDKNLLRKYSKGLICLSGCLGSDINQAILADNLELAESLIKEYVDIFGKNNFFIEVMNNSFPDQDKVLAVAPKLAKKYGLRVVATNDVHYLNREDKIVQDGVKAIDKHTTLAANENNYPAEFYLKTAEEMYTLFPDNPEWLEITQEIADRCNVELKYDKIVFPEFVQGKEKKEELLAQLCREGWKKLIVPEIKDKEKLKEYADRVKYEMDVINKNSFTDYFLIVQDIVNFARSKDIPVGGARGSVGGSLVARLLEITEGFDPIEYGLYFERFLNPGRISPPDIDLDFADNRRDEVIEYVREKYGKDNFVKTLTFGNFQPKQALRDSFKVYGYDIETQSRMADLVPTVIQGVPNVRFKHLYGQVKEFPNAIQPKLLEAKEKYPEVFFLAEKLEDNPRHSSTHASAYILADKPIYNYAPMDYDSKNDEYRIGLDMYSADDIKLLKMDFLGIETLSIVDSAVKNINNKYKVNLDLKKIPLDDEKTWDAISNADTIGIFQFESEGMRGLLKKAKPKSLLELADCNAIYRPGAAKFIDEYCQVKAGFKKAEPIHPLMEPILRDTHGVLVMQEQVMKMCQVLAGFNLSEADYMRKAIGKKKEEDMKKLLPMFELGCAKNGIDKVLVEKILSWFHDMSRYNFNKSHALAYSLNAYRSAYVKAHYPLEFTCEMLNKNAIEISEYLIRFFDAKKRGIKIQPPNVNKSFSLCKIVDEKIYFGLNLIKGTNSVAVDEIIKEREDNGVFKDYKDFFFRCYKVIEKTTLENFIVSGALDCIGINRKWALQNVEEHLKSFKKAKKKNLNQIDMFSEEETFSLPDNEIYTVPKVSDFADKEKLEKEKAVLGFYASGSPLDPYSHIISQDDFYMTNQIATKDNDEIVKLLGVIYPERFLKDKNQNDMAFAQIEDSFGKVKIIIFSKQFGTSKSLLKDGNIVIVTGRVSNGQLILMNIKKVKEDE